MRFATILAACILALHLAEVAGAQAPAHNADAEAAFTKLLEIEKLALARDPASTDPLVGQVRRMYNFRIATPTPLMLELQRRGSADQFWRSVLSPRQDTAGRLGANSQQAREAFRALVLQRMTAVDADNVAWLKADLAQRGRWITSSDVGPLAATIPFMFAQHAEDIDFQRKVLAMWEPLVAAGQADKGEYAYLFDRIAVNTGQPQRFGTQMKCSAEKKWETGPVEDPQNLDKRRIEMKLGSVADYLTGAPPCP